MGLVYEYTHKPTNKRVAIKWVVMDAEYEQDVLNEIGLGRLFHSHSGQTNLIVVSAFMHGQILHRSGEQDVYGLVTPIYAGDLVSRFLDKPRTFEEMRCVTRGIINGVRNLHNRRYVHNDIKDLNILIGLKGTPYVSDFGGLARDGAVLGVHTKGESVMPENEPTDDSEGKSAYENDMFGVLTIMKKIQRKNHKNKKYNHLLFGMHDKWRASLSRQENFQKNGEEWDSGYRGA